MKILFITNTYRPDVSGIASQHADFCEEMAGRGHEVRVHAAYPYYPQWRNWTGARLWRRAWENLERVPVLRHGLFIPRRSSSMAGRLLLEITFLFSLSRSLFGAWRADLTFVICPLTAAVAYGVLRKWFRRERLWISVQDFPAQAAAAAGLSRISALIGFGRWLETRLFAQADILSSIAPRMCERLEALTGRRVEFFPNWLGADLEGPIDAHAARPSAGIEEPWRLLYSGTIGRKQSLVPLVGVLAGWKARFRFRICGDGGEREALDAELARLADDRLERTGFQSLAQFVEELFTADFLLLPETPEAGAAFFPSKLIPALAAGTPVLAICDPDGPLGQEIRTHDLGLAFSWNELPQLETLLADAPALRIRHATWSANARTRSPAYRRETAFERWEEKVKNEKVAELMPFPS